VLATVFFSLCSVRDGRKCGLVSGPRPTRGGLLFYVREEGSIDRAWEYEVEPSRRLYMLHHFLLIIFSTRFKGVLATYLHYLLIFFPQYFWMRL
jgi:hypothetical protein